VLRVTENRPRVDPPQSSELAVASHPVLLYDGVCGLCNRLVQFILRRDPGGVFRFASLQSELAERILARHGADSRDLDTLYVIVDYELPGERVLIRSDAVIVVLNQLAAAAEPHSAGQPGACPEPAEGAAVPTQSQTSAMHTGLARWRLVASLLELVPRPLRDWGYRIVARYRYRIFGRSETCILPAPENRDRFLEV
jgi:predicted DCC family thiol-disulfide oxidoreductase YuxK